LLQRNDSGPRVGDNRPVRPTRYLVIRREEIRPGKYSERVMADWSTADGAEQCARERPDYGHAGITYRVEVWHPRSVK
jgi:hypothetical protein